MKKPFNKKVQQVETSPASISAALEETFVLKCIVEEVASSRSGSGYADEQVQPGWQAIETSSLEAYASGYLNLTEKTENIDMPFDSCFLFTCIKVKNSRYDLTWASSLS